MPLIRSALRAALPLALLATACGGDPTATAGDELLVVVTTPVLGELTAEIVGDDGQVEVLMAPGQDPHGYQPSARQAAELRRADLVVANGLGLEEALDDALEAAEEEGVVVVRVAEQLDPLAAEEGAGEHGHEDDAHDDEHDDEQDAEHDDEGEDHAPSGLDPHVWLDPLRMADAAGVIASAIGELEGAPQIAWEERASVVASELENLHERIEDTLSDVPEDCRVLVTAHDSMGYFADRYGFEVVGSVVPGTSTQANASAGHVAELARTLEERQIPAVFAETSESSRLADTLAAEVGREIAVVELPAGTLGEPASATGTYDGMMTTTAELIADALGGC